MNGIDDSEVLDKKVNSYKKFLDSESWKNIEIVLNPDTNQLCLNKGD